MIDTTRAELTARSPAIGISVLARSTASPCMMATVEINMPEIRLLTIEMIISGRVRACSMFPK
jgi:hypothetical protein